MPEILKIVPKRRNFTKSRHTVHLRMTPSSNFDKYFPSLVAYKKTLKECYCNLLFATLTDWIWWGQSHGFCWHGNSCIPTNPLHINRQWVIFQESCAAEILHKVSNGQWLWLSWSLPIPEVCSSNRVIDKNLYWTFTVNCIETTKMKKKRPGMAHC